MTVEQKEALTKKRREQIFEAAMRCWLEDGFDATTVASIAKEAGLAKGTVYLYFKTKQEILEEAIQRYSFLPDLEQMLAPLGDARLATKQVIPVLVKAIWLRAKARVPIVRFFMREVSARPEYGRRLIELVVVPFNQLATELFAKEIEEGAVRQVDMFIASRALVGMLLVFLVTQEVFDGKAVHPLGDDEICETIADVFLHGILRREGEN